MWMQAASAGGAGSGDYVTRVPFSHSPPGARQGDIPHREGNEGSEAYLMKRRCGPWRLIAPGRIGQAEPGTRCRLRRGRCPTGNDAGQEWQRRGGMRATHTHTGPSHKEAHTSFLWTMRWGSQQVVTLTIVTRIWYRGIVLNRAAWK